MSEKLSFMDMGDFLEKHGGPAFPQSGGVEQLESRLPVQGMTLRDYFAAKAMAALLRTDSDFSADPEAGSPMRLWEDFAQGAYQMADAMLEARK